LEGIRQGGFWPADALTVALVALALIVGQMVRGQVPRSLVWALASLLTLAAWWLARAGLAGHVKTFLPLGASLLGFAAALVVVQPLPAAGRRYAAMAVGLLGGAAATIGLAGVTFRWRPMAIPAQGLWRLSTVLTYADAAGLLLVLALLLVLGLDESYWLWRVVVFVCLAGAMATQSRGAALALVAGMFLVPWSRYRRMAVPLAAGLVAGVITVATSAHRTPKPAVAGAIVLCGLVAVWWTSRLTRRRQSLLRWRPTFTGALVLLVLVAGSALVLRSDIGLRAFAPSDHDRAVEWSAAAHQFLSSPWTGVGPDRLLTFHTADGTYAHFAHNEYLQVLADGGLIGAGLLLAAALALASRVRRRDDLSSAAVAALVAFAVGGLFDFDWHLPVLALLAGAMAGLAIPQRVDPGARPSEVRPSEVRPSPP
jgi:hypothetical protein